MCNQCVQSKPLSHAFRSFAGPIGRRHGNGASPTAIWSRPWSDVPDRGLLPEVRACVGDQKSRDHHQDVRGHDIIVIAAGELIVGAADKPADYIGDRAAEDRDRCRNFLLIEDISR